MTRHLKKNTQAANLYHYNIYSLKNCHKQVKYEVLSRIFFLSGSFSPFTHSIAHPIVHSIWNNLIEVKIRFYSVPRDYDGGIIKLFHEYEEKYIHSCRRKKALPMHTVKTSISPETEKKKTLSK